MAKPGRPTPGLDDYLYWQERLANREASGLKLASFNCQLPLKVNKALNLLAANSTECSVDWI